MFLLMHSCQKHPMLMVMKRNQQWAFEVARQTPDATAGQGVE
jgi:PEP-CTERM motif